MRPCIVGIGGAGGNIVENFLQSQDVECPLTSFGGEYLVFGGIKGVWLDSDKDDAMEQSFFGPLEEGCYPGYIISHDLIDPDSNLRRYITTVFGHDLKVQGYDRRAEYLKAVFEIFDKDPNVNSLARREFSRENPKVRQLIGINEDGLDNPLSGYIWRGGFRRFTSVGKHNNGAANNVPVNENELNLDRFNAINDIIAKILPGAKDDRIETSRNQSIYCDSLLFLASLGGGTGTGFINPLSRFVRTEERAYPIFALGLQTEKGKDSRHAEEKKRNLGATIAMYDLLTKPPGSGIDGLLLVDNEILVKKYSGNYGAMDKAVFEAMKPMLDPRNYPDSLNQDDAPAIRGEVLKNIPFPPILVPCHFKSKKKRDATGLVECTLKNKLYPCDHNRADMAFVFVRGLVRDSDIIDAVNDITKIPRNMINVYRKIGDGKNKEMLILLRNPYGGKPFKEGESDTLESRFIEVMESALEFMTEEHMKIGSQKNQDGSVNWMNQSVSLVNQPDYTSKTKDALLGYFYGPTGLKHRVEAAIEKLKKGERPPLFKDSLDIFVDDDQKSRELSFPTEMSKIFTPSQIMEIERIVANKLISFGKGIQNPDSA